MRSAYCWTQTHHGRGLRNSGDENTTGGHPEGINSNRLSSRHYELVVELPDDTNDCVFFDNAGETI